MAEAKKSRFRWSTNRMTPRIRLARRRKELFSKGISSDPCETLFDERTTPWRNGKCLQTAWPGILKRPTDYLICSNASHQTSKKDMEQSAPAGYGVDYSSPEEHRFAANITTDTPRISRPFDSFDKMSRRSFFKWVYRWSFSMVSCRNIRQRKPDPIKKLRRTKKCRLSKKYYDQSVSITACKANFKGATFSSRCCKQLKTITNM